MWKRSLAGLIGPDTNNETHFCLLLEEKVDVERWKTALHLLADRHDCLRIVCRDTQQGLQLEALPKVSTLPFEFVDLTNRTESDRLQIAHARASEFVWKPFELEDEFLWRTQLTKVGHREFMATLVVHHVVSDAVSIVILRHDLIARYENLLTGLLQEANRKPIGFIAYLQSMNTWLAGPAGAQSKNYWVSRAMAAPAPSYASTYIDTACVPRQTFKIPSETMQRIGRQAELRASSTLNILLAIQAMALHRHSGDTRVTLANVYAKRDSIALAFTSGYIADRLFITVDVNHASTLTSVVESIVSDVDRSYSYRHCPYEVIRQAIRESGTQLFAPLFNFLPGFARALSMQSRTKLSLIELLPPNCFTAPPREMPYRMAITEYEEHAWVDYRTCYEELQGFPQTFLAEVERVASCTSVY